MRLIYLLVLLFGAAQSATIDEIKNDSKGWTENIYKNAFKCIKQPDIKTNESMDLCKQEMETASNSERSRDVPYTKSNINADKIVQKCITSITNRTGSPIDSNKRKKYESQANCIYSNAQNCIVRATTKDRIDNYCMDQKFLKSKCDIDSQ